MNETVLDLGPLGFLWPYFEDPEMLLSKPFEKDVFFTCILFSVLGLFMLAEVFYYKFYTLSRKKKKLSFITEAQLDGSEPSLGDKLLKNMERTRSYLRFLPPDAHLEILMNSARIGNAESILQFYNKRLDLTLQDKDGNTALHEAAKHGHQEICRMLVVLSFPIEIEKIRNVLGETALDLAEDPRIQQDLKMLETGLGERKEDLHSLTNDRLVEKNAQNWPKSSKLALSMDGGGVKVLVLCQTLLHLDKLAGGHLVDKIDWTAGTSCGGVLALLMGSGRSVEYCRHFFLSGVKKVFCGNKNASVPKHHLSGINDTGKNEWGNKRMDWVRQKVLVTVCDTRKTPSELVLFRSYKPNVSEKICQEHGYLDPNRILIWKAARCTSAAPYFFESFNGLSDGGILANNPAETLISEFLQFNSLQKEEARKQNVTIDHENLGCVLSLGTGVPPQQNTEGIDLDVQFLKQRNPVALARGLINVMSTAMAAANLLLKGITSSNGQPFLHSRAWCHSLEVPFFRFSPNLKEDYAMDETNTSKLIELMWDAEIFLRGEGRKDLEQFARLIATKPPNNYNQNIKRHSDENI